MRPSDHTRRVREVAILERMEATRARLLAFSRRSREDLTRHVRSAQALTTANIARAFLTAPHVTLLGSIVLATLILGPRRVIPVVVRTSLTSWVARNVRALVGR
jgi:hypothetical protein